MTSEPLLETQSTAAFLRELSEATHLIDAPERVMEVVTERLGQRLAVSRCAYAEVEADGENFTIRHDYTRGCGTTVGQYRLSLFGPRAVADMSLGRTLVVRSVDAELGAGADMFNAIQVKAIVCCPLVREGKLVAMMAVHQTTARDFTDEEIRLVEAVVSRSWLYIESARARRMLRESEARLLALADALPHMVWAAQRDGTLDYYNSRWYAFVGASAQADWLAHVHPEDLPRARATWLQSVSTGEEFAYEFRAMRADGSYRWLSARAMPNYGTDGAVQRWFGTFTDVHDRKEAEDALDQSRRHLDFVMRGADVGAWSCPLPFDTLSWDAKVKEHFHLPPDAQVDIDTFFARIHPEDREPTRLAIEHSIATNTVYEIDYRTVSPATNEVKWIRAIGRPYYDEAGIARRFDGVTLDVTRRKRAEIELHETELRAAKERAELLESERAARRVAERESRMKDEFLATLSHELRTPLNAVLGWAYQLRHRPQSAEDLEKGLVIIERNARSQAQIVKDLLDMSRIIAGKLRLELVRLDLRDVARAAMETVSPSAQLKQIELSLHLEGDSFAMQGDPDRLQQVVWNLLSNAIKFTPRGGKVALRVEAEAGQARIVVSDTGEGIVSEFLPHVFERFRQADASITRRHGGLGLGLSIVKQLVEMHGGTISAQSEGQGRGARFVIHLPQLEAHTAQHEGDAERVEPETALEHGVVDENLSGLSVLVLDDEEDTRLLIERVLRARGAEVTLAERAADAFEAVSARPFDVIVSDIGMPDEDGYTLLRRIRALERPWAHIVPAVALTAYARIEDRLRAVRAGFQLHLAKPCDAAELVAIVKTLADAHPVRR